MTLITKGYICKENLTFLSNCPLKKPQKSKKMSSLESDLQIQISVVKVILRLSRQQVILITFQLFKSLNKRNRFNDIVTPD